MNDTELRAFVTSKITVSFLLDSAKQLGVIQRQSRFDLVLFVWTMCLGCFQGGSPSLARIHKTYNNLARHSLCRSAFYARFGEPMAALFALLFEHVLRTCIPHAHWLKSHLDLFDDVLVFDSTTLALRKGLEHAWKACHPGQSALKIHAIYNVLDMTLFRIQLTDARAHDICGIKHVKDFCYRKLLLFDMAYISVEILRQIQEAKGMFVCRLPQKFQPVVLKELRRGPGRPSELAGKPLRHVLKSMQRRELDVWVRVGSGAKQMECRLIGVRDQEGRWRLYLTNLKADEVEAHEVVELYRVRWQVELMFKALKSRGGLDALEGNTAATVKIQMYSILIGYTLCGALVGQARTLSRQGEMSMTRALAAMEVMGRELLEMICPPPAARDEWLERFAGIVSDPNINRSRSTDPLLRTSSLSYANLHHDTAP